MQRSGRADLARRDEAQLAGQANPKVDEHSVSFAVVANLDSLPRLIQELRRRGEIDGDGVAGSLFTKAESALQANGEGKRDAAVNKLEALLNDVRAQAGKHVSSRAANLLDIEVRTVIGQL